MKQTPSKPTKRYKSKKCKESANEITPRKIYRYDKSSDLPFYGVIVRWDSNTKYSNKALRGKLESILDNIGFQHEAGEKSALAAKSLKYKPIPFIRRVGPNKAIVMFGDKTQANVFADLKDEEFQIFIPMSFICTVGVAVFNKFNFKMAELQSLFPSEYTVLQWRKKRLDNGKIQVSISVQGSKIPETLNFKGDIVPFELFERKPTHCKRCLRYGHRTGDCMRKPRCGVCTPIKPNLRHMESKCSEIKRNPKLARCMFCSQEHSIGNEECVEHIQQREFKMKLVKHKMDYLSVLEKDILPAIRTTAVNSNRIWLD